MIELRGHTVIHTAAAGMDACLTKPIRESDLFHTIHQLLATPAS